MLKGLKRLAFKHKYANRVLREPSDESIYLVFLLILKVKYLFGLKFS